MDLIFLLAVLYAWECLRTVPANTVVLNRLWAHVKSRHGGGVLFLNPVPSARCVVSGWFPFRLDGGELRSAVPLTRTGLPDQASDGRRRELRADSRVEVTGSLLRIDGDPFLRAVSPAHAHHLRDLCLRLAPREGPGRERMWRAALRRSWNATALRDEVRRLRRATRWLAPICDASVSLAFLIAPAAALTVGEDAALLALGPAWLVLHIAGVLALHSAQRHLKGNPGQGGAGRERLLVALLYPPALWRTPQELWCERLAPYAPPALAAVLADDRACAALLRRRLAILDSPRAVCDPAEGCTESVLERRALERLACARGLPMEKMTAPPADPQATVYCPVCLAAYLTPVTGCGDCGVQTRGC